MYNNNNKLPIHIKEALSMPTSHLGDEIVKTTQTLEAPNILLAAICFMMIDKDRAVHWHGLNTGCYRTTDGSLDLVSNYKMALQAEIP